MATIPTVTLRDLLASWDVADVSGEDGDENFLDKVGLDDFSITDLGNGIRARLSLSFTDELGFQFPGLDCLGLYFGSAGSTHAITVECEIGATVTFKLVNVGATLRFRQALLRRVAAATGGGYKPMLDNDGTPLAAQISLSGVDVVYTVGGSLRIETPTGGPQLSLPPVMIADTGVVIESQAITLHLNRDAPPPAGADPGFVGVHIASAAVHLPAALAGTAPPTLSFTNARIGSDGFTGTIAASNLGFSGSLGSARFALDAVALSFERNVLTQSVIGGSLALPFFDKPVQLEFGIAANGSVLVRLSSASGVSVERANVAKLTIKAIALDARTEDVTVEISGSLQPLFGGQQWPIIEVSQLRIHSDGRVELPGGWITLPAQKTGALSGFPLDIRQIGFGSQGQKRWVGFSGGLKLIDGMPIGGSVEGLKILWDPNHPDAPPQVELRGVSVKVRVPRTLSIDASISFYQEGDKSIFRGSGTLVLEALGLTLDAQLLVGRTSEYTFFYVFVEAGLPAGIPLASTGLALYGLGGLVGINVTPDRRDGEGWYDGWYKRDPIGPTHSTKWRDAGGRYAFGASVTLGTLPDNGQAMHGRVLVIVMIPGPVIMIEGRVNLVKDRKEMTPTSEPRFRGLAVIDGEAGTLQVNLEPRFLVPDGQDKPGSMVDVTGMAEAFFDFHHGDRWYLNIGEKDPKERRIRAKLLSLFDANAYVMVNQKRLAFGAMVGYDIAYSYGPVGLRLAFWFETDALLVFRPIQFSADAGLHGRAELKAFGIGIAIALDATAHLETPEPFAFKAELHLSVDLPWPLPDVNFTLPYEYKEPIRPVLPVPLQQIDVLTRKATESWDTALQGPGQTIPLDARPVLVFAKAIHDEQRIGSNVQPADEERSGDLTLSYHLDEVVVERQVQGAWTAVAARPAPPGGRELFGMWLPAEQGDDGAPNCKLQLFAKTPFEAWNAASTDAAAEAFAAANPGYPWVYERMDFDGVAAETPIGAGSDANVIDGLDFDAGALNPAPKIVATAGITALRSARARKQRALWLSPQYVITTAGGSGTSVGSGAAPGPRRFSLRITFPAAYANGVRSVRLRLSTSAVLTAVARDAAGFAIATHTLRDDTRTGLVALRGVQHRTLVLSIDGIRHIDLDAGPTWLHAVEWVPSDASVSNAAAMANHNAAETSRWAEDEFLFEPDSQYRIRVRCRSRAVKAHVGALLPDRPDAGRMGPTQLPAPTTADNTNDYRFEQTVYLRTEGAPGFVGDEIDRSVSGGSVSVPPEAGTPQAPSSRMRTLQPYVARTLPADPLRPFYRGYDVCIDFNESYIQRMYALSGRSLTLALRDGNGVAPVAASLGARWRKSDDTPLRLDETQWANLAASGGGPALPTASRPAFDALDVSVRAPLLRPDTVYTASLVAVPANGAIDPELHRFTLRSSRYAGFAQHVGSFDGRVDTSATRPPALSSADRARLIAAAQSATEDDFATIVGLFGLTAVTVPDALRCTPLADAGQRWGVLIESPEPFDRDRIEIGAQWYQNPLAPNRRGDAWRMLDLQTGDRGGSDFNGEWIDLVAMRSGDLAGTRLVQVVGTGTQTVLHTFGAGSMLEEGEVIRVHAGAAPTSLPADGRLHRYTGNAAWMLGSAESEVRLVAADNVVLSVQAMPPGWVAREVHVVWNADRTRVAVLPKARAMGCLFAGIMALPLWLQQIVAAIAAQPALNMEAGTWRLGWRHRADIRATLAGTPVLRRRGLVADETAAMQVRVN